MNPTMIPMSPIALRPSEFPTARQLWKAWPKHPGQSKVLLLSLSERCKRYVVQHRCGTAEANWIFEQYIQVYGWMQQRGDFDGP